jgi:hypothetical protein
VKIYRVTFIDPNEGSMMHELYVKDSGLLTISQLCDAAQKGILQSAELVGDLLDTLPKRTKKG